MRIWHYGLLPYLPELQFKGQLRELLIIMRTWRKAGGTNHLLINKVMEYPKSELYNYFLDYSIEYEKRYDQKIDYFNEFFDFANHEWYAHPPFEGWHDYEYLRVCMANLYEKHRFGVGKSKITDEQWKTLSEGYKFITGEEYKI